jgi:hypothetical protein
VEAEDRVKLDPWVSLSQLASVRTAGTAKAEPTPKRS